MKPLTQALADHDARFASGFIIAEAADAQGHASHGGGRLQRKLETMFANFPAVEIGDRLISHKISGMFFASVALSGTEYLLGCGEVPGFKLQRGQPISVTSGMCLFGADSIIGQADGPVSLAEPNAITQLATPITSLFIDERIHVYEAETIARLGSCVRDLGQALEQPLLLSFNLPTAEYDMYGLDLYARGLLDRRNLLKYVEAVHDRAARLERLLADELANSQVQPRIASTMPWLKVSAASELSPDAVAPAVYEAAGGQDALWRRLLKVKPPHSLLELNYLSYVYHYFNQAALARRGGRQHIIIENPDEAKIYDNAAEIQARIGQNLKHTCGLYAHPKVVVTETALGIGEYVLYDCHNGTDPRNIKLATQDYTDHGQF